MKYRQIGNGGAFNFKMTNSSFVIWNKDEYTLFDCGWNVYAELRRLDEEINENFDITKLKNIYISHLDDDHVGSLKTLIYYQYFINKIVLNVYCDYKLTDSLFELLKDCNGYFENGEKVSADLCMLNSISPDTYHKFLIDGVKVTTTNTHHHVDCYGAIFNTPGKAIFITGDTKATSEIELLINGIDHNYQKYVIFHDYNSWNEPGSNVHACFSDVNDKYPEEMRKKITWYHTDEPFDNKWKEL